MPRDAEGSSSRAQARLRACTSSKKMGKKKAAPPPPPPDDDDDDGPDLGFSLAGDGSDDDNDEKPSEAPAASEKNAESKAADGTTTTTSEPDRAALLKKHRQEEQQIRADAKQKLFAVPKSDKAARAAAEEERDAALRAMAERHARELGEEVVDIADGVASLAVGAAAGGKKKSKAQKKEEAERAREQRIADAHAGAGPSERLVEMEKLDAQLKPLGLVIHEIPADGHCLYRSLAHQLQLRAADNDGGGGAAEDHLSCRREIAAHIRSHPNDFVPFLAESGATDLAAYCETIESSNEWGGQLEITALAHSRKACITVFSADAPPLLTGEEYKALGGPCIELAYHRHYYGLGEHYNSVRRAS